MTIDRERLMKMSSYPSHGRVEKLPEGILSKLLPWLKLSFSSLLQTESIVSREPIYYYQEKHFRFCDGWMNISEPPCRSMGITSLLYISASGTFNPLVLCL